MIIKEKYAKNIKLSKLSGTIVFFANKKFEIKNTKSLLNQSENNLIKRNLNNNNKKKEIFSFDISHNQKIIVYSAKDSKNCFEKSGAKLYEFFKKENLNKVHLFGDTIENSEVNKSLHKLVHGMRLKSYSFNKYLTKKNSEILNLSIITKKKVDIN